MIYKICAKDPSGEFVQGTWSTPTLPRVGEHLMLPTPASTLHASGWQELTVDEIFYYPNRIEVWLGGHDGWTAGSVTELFTAAAEVMAE